MDFTISPQGNSVSRQVDCVDPAVEAAESTHEGCPIRTKRRVVTIKKGQCIPVAWEMRWPDGVAADLSACLGESDGSVSDSSSSSESESATGVSLLVRFRLIDSSRPLAETTATATTAATGRVSFTVPSCVASAAGIYRFEVALVQDEACCEILFSDSGVLIVEDGMWGDQNQQGGPPSLEDIRMALRDRGVENDLLQDVEFDDAEIVHCLVAPVRQFNETPPPLTIFTTSSFPYRYHWTLAAAGELLRIAAHHYLRNKLQAQSGQLSVDDKNKNQEYMQLAELYRREWMEFIVQRKVSLNATQGYGTLSSIYANGYYGD